ncbi:mitochondral 37S ribosomal protein S27 [Scheffersomyces spartinae]|uniref:Small ribosomal subunit protein mS33 n=1 Tax=Scheffersomyces spartinae TaxID=45513 RepID=A0A9P8AK71_9ASCO|nr:mitochondral 37S ribosomal protein S27 [Scheffersomyces spartinae]KAG7195587.1 mitochondral 37S ribosomal protein S27 [Scheffersomyces spartinae]
MSSFLQKLPVKARIQQLKALSASIFQENWNPANARNGSKFLRKELKGPEVVKYYGDNSAVPTFSDFKKWFPELNLTDPREVYRLKMVADRKRRNKGAPKKKKEAAKKKK